MITFFYILIKWLVWLGYCLLITTIIFSIFMKRRTVLFIIFWLQAIHILPLLAIVMYFSSIELDIKKKHIKLAKDINLFSVKWFNSLKFHKNIFIKSTNNVISSQLFKLCEKRQGITGIKVNKLQLISNTNNVIKFLIKDMQHAKRCIEMVFYIWQPGGIIDSVAESLIEAKLRGIHCRLMLDSVGSIEFFRSSWVRKMRNVGIEVVEALKIKILSLFTHRIDSRQHRKMVLIDNYIAYTGSMNMVDPNCFKQDIGVGKWIDAMIRMEGPIAIRMGIIYSCDWEIETGQSILPKLSDIKKISFKQKGMNFNTHIIASGLGFPKDLIHQGLLTAIYASCEYLVITTPYFVPSNDLLNAICLASQRGVEVSIILPRKNDSFLVSWASRAFFSDLLLSGVKIYQFEDGLLHTKSILIDRKLSLIGTMNFDMRSIWLNFEVILITDNIQFGKDLDNLQKDYISKSRLLDINLWNNRPFWHRIIENLFYIFNSFL